jgi:serine protease Do
MLIAALALCLALPAVTEAQTPREKKVHEDRKKIEAEGFWIYNDLAKGFAESKKSGKPMLVVLRCIPCNECVKLDDDLVNQDKRIRPLLEKFVRVRVVSTNGLDLSLFQFDFDQSFAAVMLNADGMIYGRFGTRSHRTSWADDVSIEGLGKALQGALDLHADREKNKKALAGKKGTALEYATPEKFPSLARKYTATLDYKGNVVQSCIHCHQIGDAQREHYRKRGESIPETVLFPYPHPKSLGLILDPKERSTVLRVEKDSAAEKAGFQKGDVIEQLAGQPLLSIADVQWVLHQTLPDGGKVTARVKRGDAEKTVSLALEKGWRRKDDLSWRTSTWGLRRMATGGLVLESLSANERKKAELSDEGMALRVERVGQYGPHAAAKQAGFRQGDILVSFDGKELAREQDVIVHGLTNRKPGDKVKVELLRDGKKMTLTLPIQE